MDIVGLVRAAMEIAALALLALVHARLRALPARVARIVEAARAQGAEEAASRLVGRIAQIAGDGSGLIIQLRTLLEEQDERNRAERAAAEVRARIAERKVVSAPQGDFATTDDDNEATRHRGRGPRGVEAGVAGGGDGDDEETTILPGGFRLRAEAAAEPRPSSDAREVLRVGPDEPTPASGTSVARSFAPRCVWVLVSTPEAGG